MNKKTKTVTFEEHLDTEYGKKGTATRENYEQGFEAFKIGVILQELRKQNGLTQDQLAEKCGTNKYYISEIENNTSEIKLSEIMRIIYDGFGKHLRFSIDI